MGEASPELHEALAAYWAATTHEEQRLAYRRCRELGLPPSYGEAPDPAFDEPWQFGGWGA